MTHLRPGGVFAQFKNQCSAMSSLNKQTNVLKHQYGNLQMHTFLPCVVVSPSVPFRAAVPLST